MVALAWDEPTEEEMLKLVQEEEVSLKAPLTRETWHLTRWCDHCKRDNHHKCTGVDCYECKHPYHRFQGVKRLGNKEEWS